MNIIAGFVKPEMEEPCVNTQLTVTYNLNHEKVEEEQVQAFNHAVEDASLTKGASLTFIP